MTIANRTLNNRLGYLETCAEEAPEGVFDRAKTIVEVIHDVSSAARKALLVAGFKAGNDDRMRNLEIALYEYVLASNPDEYEITTAEGFGEHAHGPSGERVLAQLVRDRDILAGLVASGHLAK